MFCEQLVNALAPVVEDPPHVAANFQRMNQSPQDAKRQPVSHHIDHLGSTVVRFKQCVWCQSLYGPDLCTSTKRCGGAHWRISVLQ